MSLFSDPISGLFGVFFKKALDSKVMQYVVLLLEMGIAGTLAFLAFAGGALVARQPVAWSVGTGMVAAAIAMLATFQASPNSKGLVISFPSKLADERIDTPTTTIERKTK